MGVDEQIVAHEAELVANTCNGGAKVVLAAVTPTGEMALDEPPEHATGSTPERQFCGLKMKIHPRLKSKGLSLNDVALSPRHVRGLRLVV